MGLHKLTGRIDINHVNYLLRQIDEINNLNLSEVDFYEDCVKIEVDKNITEEFKFTGLNNIDFIRRGFYKHGFEETE